MLKCEQNTQEVSKKVVYAAKRTFPKREVKRDEMLSFFEHGQWWVRFYDLREERDRVFSVHDAEGYGSINGFCFEEV